MGTLMDLPVFRSGRRWLAALLWLASVLAMPAMPALAANDGFVPVPALTQRVT